VQNKILIYSAGDYAREVCWSIEEMHKNSDLEVKFIDDSSEATTVAGWEVIRYDEALTKYNDWQMVNAIGNPRTRNQKISQSRADGFAHTTVIHPSAALGPRIEIGEGCIIQANASLTCDIVLGVGVSINLNCTVGHDVRIGDCVSMSPLTAISGRVEIEDYVRIGTGVSIINGTREKPLRIGKGAFIAAGATVTKDIPEDVLVAGTPARVIKNLSKSK